MLTYEQALAAITQAAGRYRRSSETVDYQAALGRVLARSITAGFDLPRFNNSGVDGYGVLVEDLIDASAEKPKSLELSGQVNAGAETSAHPPDLKSGQCLRILTGAPVPDSVEAVVMREYCTEDEASGRISIATSTRIGENMRMRGEEVEAGANVLGPGMLVSPPIVGLLATLGQTRIDVFKQPRVSVVSTGDELVEPGTELSGAQIYNSNTPALVAALRSLGLDQVRTFHARDEEGETRSVLSEAMECSDVVISVGGVSVGERDYIKGAFEALDVRTVFWRIAIKPGKPVYFGLVESNENAENPESNAVQKLIFGLPGNPVSALVTFNLFVKPALKIMAGLKEKAERITTAKLARNLIKKPGRLEFVRGQLGSAEDGALRAQATTGQESHMLTGLAEADCLMLFAADLEFLPEGSTLPVQILNWHE